jgi:20S proteasome alpha/beta subunit
MTYILGYVCYDGIVLVSDRKLILEGGATCEYEDKLFNDISWMVVGSSGTAGLFEKFRERLTTYLWSPGRENTVSALTNQIELITRDLNTSYQNVLGGRFFDVLLGIKTSLGAELSYIHPIGFAEKVRKYKAIGHGEPYGSFFLKRWWNPFASMLRAAELGFFIIKYIQEFELDNTVGIGAVWPQIFLIPHKIAPTNATPEQTIMYNPHPPSEAEMKAMEERVSKRLQFFFQIPWEPKD